MLPLYLELARTGCLGGPVQGSCYQHGQGKQSPSPSESGAEAGINNTEMYIWVMFAWLVFWLGRQQTLPSWLVFPKLLVPWF